MNGNKEYFWHGVYIGIHLGVLIIMVLDLITSSEAEGSELRYFGFEAAKIYNERQSYIPEYTTLGGSGQGEEYWDYRVSALFNLDLLKLDEDRRLYWNNDIYGKSTNVQYRETGWKFELGIKAEKVDLFWSHHSTHVLEQAYLDRYPLQDRYGIRVNFYGTP